ncbi:group III truncated hemoglobin [Aurantimonas sp. 22II-16-19i]|uniref:group III truncated hemoglobin n=1 Tax=Aurantimonas sp. 22II-16-19i TaxID=1317114 RepID=UPI0009F7EAA8|nr:group III truncated hemoglobin [Aurantimonas sp. 22II-16-19i]ORE90730.1 Sec-independent protein translocase [Aurantimonas sp. 22II-16-19i]
MQRAIEPSAIVTEEALFRLVSAFYARVREDEALGPLFAGAVGDWPAHLERLTAFWSSVVLGSGRYKGNPFAAHLRHADAIDSSMFDRWLVIWRETTASRFPPETAALLQFKADRIAESLKAGLFFRPELAALQPRPAVPSA